MDDPTPNPRLSLLALKERCDLICSTPNDFDFYEIVHSRLYEKPFTNGSVHKKNCSFFEASSEEVTEHSMITNHECPFSLHRLGILTVKPKLSEASVSRRKNIVSSSSSVHLSYMVAVEPIEGYLLDISLKEDLFNEDGEMLPMWANVIRQLLPIPSSLDKQDLFVNDFTSNLFLVKKGDFYQVKLLNVESCTKGLTALLSLEGKKEKLSCMYSSLRSVLQKLLPPPSVAQPTSLVTKTILWSRIVSQTPVPIKIKPKNLPFSEMERSHFVESDLKSDWYKALNHPLLLNAFERSMAPLLLWVHFDELENEMNINRLIEPPWKTNILKSKGLVKEVFDYHERNTGIKWDDGYYARFKLLRHVAAHVESNAKKRKNRIRYAELARDLLILLEQSYLLHMYIDTPVNIWISRVLRMHEYRQDKQNQYPSFEQPVELA